MGSIYLGSNCVVPYNVNLVKFGAENPNMVYDFSKTIYLNETNYSSLTPSTSQQTLQLPATAYTANPSTSIILDRYGPEYHNGTLNWGNKDYLLVSQVIIDIKYTQNESSLTMPHALKYGGVCYYYYFKYPSTFNITTGYDNNALNSSTNSTQHQTFSVYRKADGTLASGSTYGFYCYPSNILLGITNASNPNTIYCYFQLSGWYMRGHTTYHDVTAYNYVNATTTSISINCKLYEVDRPCWPAQLYLDRNNYYNSLL